FPTRRSSDLDRAALGTVGPKPDKRHGLHSLRLHRERQQALETLFDGSIDRPPRERNVLPAAQICPMNVLPDRNRQERTQTVVEAPRHRAATKPFSISIAVFQVAFVDRESTRLNSSHERSSYA